MTSERERYYFIADTHLGLDYANPEHRERELAMFLSRLPQETKEVFLLGDIFDFWYEYKEVIPRHFTRVLGAIAALTDRGVKVHFFNGNHDIWTYNYLQEELGVIVEQQPSVFEIAGKRFCLGHGDGLWERDKGYDFLQRLFRCRFIQVLFSALHPRWAFLLGHSWSKHNRLTRGEVPVQVRENVLKRSKEWIAEYQSKRAEGEKIDFFIFGHHHINVDEKVAGGARLIILGDWINNPPRYVVFDGSECRNRKVSRKREKESQ